MPKKPGGSALRRAVALSTVLAVLLVLVSVAAGGLGARAWRADITKQSDREFRRQAGAVEVKVRQRIDALDRLFALTSRTSRAGKPLAPALRGVDAIKEYPGVIAIGHATGDPNGALSITDEFSVVSAFGVADLQLRNMVGTQLRRAVHQAGTDGRIAASGKYDLHWFTSSAEPAFFLATATTPGKPADGWTVTLVYGNWILQDSIQAAGSSFRGELLDGSTVLARDYLPIGSQASKPPPPIDDRARRAVTTIDDFGRPMSLVVADTEGITTAQLGRQPWMLFAGTSLLGLLSGLLVWCLGRSRARALRMVAEATAQLRHQAFHDDLTGLANRALLADRMTRALARRAVDGEEVAVLLCDLDDFKSVNDTLGHAAGDELLTQVAERLTVSARSGDTVARLGGDEFAILLESPAGEAEAQAVADRILIALREPVHVADRPMLARASIGIAVGSVGMSTDARPGSGSGAGMTADRLLHNADSAMYAAKRSGKTCSAVFRAPASERADDRPGPVPPRRPHDDVPTRPKG